jgi:hypothetical protein
MSQRLVRLGCSVLAVALVLTGCVLRASIPTQRPYALARRVEGSLAVLATDDPLYEAFDEQVLSDATLQCLLGLFEHTTESFLATNGVIPAPQTVANYLLIVADSEIPGVLHDTRVAVPGGQARVELALGLGQEGRVDLTGARHRMAAAMGPLLLELVGRRPPEGFTLGALTSPDTPVSSQEALWAGYALALEADYARPYLDRDPHDVPLAALPLPPEDLLARQSALCAGEATGPREEAVRTPSRVAALLIALHRQAGHYYPQQYMLWMVSYEPEEVPYAKVLLAMLRMPPGDATVEDLIATYAHTYPAERHSVHALADAILGPGDRAAGPL